MLLEVVLISLIIALVRGGSLKNLTYLHIDGIGYMLIGVIIYSFFIRYIANSNSEFSTLLFSNLPLIYILSFGLILFGLYKNKHITGIKLSMAGIVLNQIVIILNGGRMPVSEDALLRLNMLDQLKILQQDIVITHTLINSSTKLYLLSDIIPVRYILPKVISIGDILLSIGIFLMIQKFATSQDMLQ